MTSLCLSLILVGLLIGWPAAWLARALGRKLNAMDGAGVSGQVKVAPRRVPNTGGIGIFIAIALPLLLVLLLANLSRLPSGENWFASRGIFPEVAVHWEGIQQQTPAALILLGCLLLLHIMGIIDDRRPLGPGVKLPVMLLAALTVVIATDTRLLTLLDGYGPGGHWLSIAITVFWIVVITNAFNFLDNMDGLSAGVAAISAAAFLTTALVGGQWFVAALLALLLGALLGFLRYNFPFTKSGATLFMGDSGSLIVGFLLAVLSIRITYLPFSSTPPPLHSSTSHAFLILTPLIILSIPLYDFCSVCFIRIRQGRSPFVGDLQHFSHRLVKHGLSRRSAVLVIYGCTAVTGIGAIALPKLEPWQAALVGVQTLLVLLVIALYEWSRPPAANPAP
jgi:UDP-GlcNAc:undecaprenyl-phosphate/decaprenyl-phosphate GlcNAc-1-phosphate transferase